MRYFNIKNRRRDLEKGVRNKDDIKKKADDEEIDPSAFAVE